MEKPEKPKTSFDNRLLSVFKNFNPTGIFILGISGSGKTNIALYLTEWLVSRTVGFTVYYEKFSSPKELVSYQFPNRPSILIFDDFTYLCVDRQTPCMKFLRKYTMARHVSKVFIAFFITHYIRAIMPILRQTHIRILTSLLTIKEIKDLQEYFDLTALWDYYNIFRRGETKKGLALVNVLGYHAITRFPIARSYDCVLDRKNPNITNCIKNKLKVKG